MKHEIRFTCNECDHNTFLLIKECWGKVLTCPHCLSTLADMSAFDYCKRQDTLVWRPERRSK